MRGSLPCVANVSALKQRYVQILATGSVNAAQIGISWVACSLENYFRLLILDHPRPLTDIEFLEWRMGHSSAADERYSTIGFGSPIHRVRCGCDRARTSTAVPVRCDCVEGAHTDRVGLGTFTITTRRLLLSHVKCCIIGTRHRHSKRVGEWATGEKLARGACCFTNREQNDIFFSKRL